MRILQLLYRSAAYADHTRKTVARQAKPYIERTLDYIHVHYADSGLSIKEIARTLFVHENYLSRLFKAAMNVTFREYLTQKRIETSAALMEQGYRSVHRIAEMVGYSDALYSPSRSKNCRASLPASICANWMKNAG